MRAKKLVAPILWTLITIILCFGWMLGVVYSAFSDGIAVSWLAVAVVGIPLLICAGISLYVMIERIKEIRSGEEDDLGQY
ncbi:MAG: hypothetical protein FWF88_09180 [Peptococcaceae bacterium]|jgi:Na+/proline symporter|nr:hypothetical protein [Peptococcaceae bacterium]MDR2736350.1 hypothetical protein [Gracilibacteraceae bacterium]